MKRGRTTTPEYFWSRVKKGPSEQCWIWSGYTDATNGYGLVGWKNKVVKAHRLAYELHYGVTLPKVLKITKSCAIVMHECDNPPCCNPTHLRLATVDANNKDRNEKGRGNSAKADANGARKYPERLFRGENHYSKTKPELLLRGSDIGNSILTETDIPVIRQLLISGVPQGQIGRKYGVSREAICRISRNRTWKHVP